MITLLVMTDGRYECIEPVIERAESMLFGPITKRIIHDDSGDIEYTNWLRKKYLDYTVYATHSRSGFGWAIISAWRLIDTPWIFHLEDDFMIQEPIDLRRFITVMDNNPNIVQMALQRQPWNETERAAGSIINVDSESYIEKTDGTNRWTEHRKFFTTNPSLYRKKLTLDHPWPIGKNSEGLYGFELFDNQNHYSAFWGSKTDPPKCLHIGTNRTGSGY